LKDSFNRNINYIRLSVTDRCDFRCLYCMAEEMTFLPRDQVLSLEEMLIVAKCFVKLGVNKIRITGGEPLVRKNIMWLMEELGQLKGLDQLVITTNGSQLEKYAADLKKAGVKRINVSMDSLDEQRFAKITRTGKLDKVLAGLDEAHRVGFRDTKINAVILKGFNDDEILDLVDFIKQRNMHISFIEEMPLGNVDYQRKDTFITSDTIKSVIEQKHTLLPSNKSTTGPSKYHQLDNSDSLIGFISPNTHNFCAQCNRVRVTVEGRLLLCLGNEHSVDLRKILRTPQLSGAQLEQSIETAIIDSMAIKPYSHEFNIEEAPRLVRFMSTTGG